MTGNTPLPHRCPHCGASFGWGPDAPLLSICNNVPFREPAPCCGQLLTGQITDGVPAFDTPHPQETTTP